MRRGTPTVSCLLRGACIASLCAAPGVLHASGGHFAVDDAALLDPGSCHVESWYERFRGGDAVLQVGPACNIAGADWTLSYERVRPDSGESSNAFTPEAKFARELGRGWAIGGAAGTTYDSASSRWERLELRLPLSYFISDAAALHATVAHAFERGEDNVWFFGAGSELMLPANMALLVEAFREDNEWFGRVGLRYFLPADGWAIDLSHASSEEGGGDRWTTLGLNVEFNRPF